MSAIALGLFSLWIYAFPVIVGKAELAWSAGAWDSFLLQVLILTLIPPTTIFLIYTVFVRMGMGPVELDVTDSGLTFTFLSHKKVEFRWNDPSLNLMIHDGREMPLANPLIAIKLIVESRHTFIPPEALEQIRNQAESHRLSVTEKEESDVIDSSRRSKVLCIGPA